MKCAYVMVVMAVFWATEALPLAVTALVPVVLFPILGKPSILWQCIDRMLNFDNFILYVGVMTTDAVGKEYLKETNLMFMSGIMVALAVEHCNLHTRIALKVLLLVGTGVRRCSQ